MTPVHRRQVLVAVAATQLMAGVAGNLLAIRRQLAYDIALVGWTGQPQHVLRDSWLLGTGVSAPVTMLAAQTVATARLARGHSQTAIATLGTLGAMMMVGYPIERQTRTALTPRTWDPVATPIATTGVLLAAAMTAMAYQQLLCGRRPRHDGGVRRLLSHAVVNGVTSAIPQWRLRVSGWPRRLRF